MHALSFACVDFCFCVFHAHIADCGAEIYSNLASYYTVKLATLSKSVQNASDLLKY